MPGQRISAAQKSELIRLMQSGECTTVPEAALRVRISSRSAYAILRGLISGSAAELKVIRRAEHSGDPRSSNHLSNDAKRARIDFGFFQRRYFGRIAVGWQIEAAEAVVQYLESPEEEYVVINAPPGSGKSTTFTLDIPAWITCRNRAIRGLIGSRTQTQARWYTARLLRAFERTQPVRPEQAEIAAGRAVDAEATLSADFGRFKPMGTDTWTKEAFVVEQPGGQLIDEKEATWQAFGMDSGFLGGRFDIVLWDDVVDLKTIRTVEAREGQQAWWDDQAETRLEPGGLLVLQGQRMGADDLYRYALDKQAGDLDDEDDDQNSGILNSGSGKKYHHLVFRAHYEDRCTGDHGREAKAYPDGCLLYPRRLPWRKLKGLMANRGDKFRVIYQQEDVDPSTVLVKPGWVSGGTDRETGELLPGCWDKDRDACQLPGNLAGQLLSIATADPSPTKYWSVQWWIVRCEDGQAVERYLMDLIRQSMDAPDFLDWNQRDGVFSGVMHEWQERSVELGWPISTWIVEANAAQRFLLQYDHVRRWQTKYGVGIVPHQTQRNKADPELGIQTIAPHWKYGRVRLPGKQHSPGIYASMKLVDEVTRWPEGRTDDCVLAEWFLEWNLPNLIPLGAPMPRMSRPTWLRQADTYARRAAV